MFPPIKSTVEPTAGTWVAEHGFVVTYPERPPQTDPFEIRFMDLDKGEIVASIFGPKGVAAMDDPQAIADANVMAAAKELYAVAVEIEANTALSDALRKKARAAIRKAKGLTNGQEAHRPRRRRKLAYL
ncbi:hypothetical protein [Paraburkholderia terrae]|uniref:hypothetical protein n=1 Tax=Paraburkholderia terrae TaxID=311230 RepID=UPI001EE2CEBC|nr:hypothetical protein [Paraburkholderia terrae]GJH00233.1 hypothetical protein CBA19C8_06770 [Paraburkholderia terrae]